MTLSSIFGIFVAIYLSSFAFSQDSFTWQGDDYCLFEDEIVDFETRCGFQVVTDFEDGDPSNPEWYVRQTDKMDIANSELSSLDVSMYHRYGDEFPVSEEEAEVYWEGYIKYLAPDGRAVIEDAVINGKNARKITIQTKQENGELSVSMEQLVIEDKENFVYTINIRASSNSWKKLQTYLKESDRLIESISWR